MSELSQCLRNNRFNCPTLFVDAAAEALDAKDAEIARLESECAQLQSIADGALTTAQKRVDAAWDEAIEVAATVADNKRQRTLGLLIRELKR